MRVEALENRWLLATVVVNTIVDTADGDTSSIDALIASPGGDGVISLREAITAANSQAGDDIINLSVTGTISLASALPDLTSNMQILGPGADSLTVLRDTGGDYRIFAVVGGPAVEVELDGLTIANGVGEGGGIANLGGTLTVSNSAFTNNKGGGSYSITGSPLTENNTSSLTVGAGGGIANLGGTLTVSNSVFTDNIGGGIYNTGTLTVGDSIFSSNDGATVSDENASPNPPYSIKAGSGIYNANGGQATVTGSTFSDNEGNGIFNYYAASMGSTITAVSVSDSTFSGNQAGAGGGILSLRGALTVSNSTFFHNSAVGLSLAAGGGICSFLGGSLTVSDSTFADNQAGYDIAGVHVSGSGGYGGGISATYGVVTNVSNSTFSGNRAYNIGGGIFRVNPTISAALTVTNSTFSGNSATINGAGGIYGGGTVANTIIAGNTGPSGGPSDVVGSFTSNGYNLIGTTSGSSGFGVMGDLVGISPRLAPLANYGGPTQTMALLPDSPVLQGSPAIGAGSNASVPAGATTDQRGFPRINGACVDIGAFESSGPGLVVSGSVDADAITVEPGSLTGLKTTVTNLVTSVSVVNDNVAVDGLLLVEGLAGNDTITITASPAGHLVVNGGVGSDTYHISFGHPELRGTVAVGDNGTGGSDFDTLTVHGTLEVDTLDKGGGFIKWRRTGDPEYLQEVDFDGMEHVTLDAAAGNDTIHDPNSGNFLILGGPGDDTIIVADTIGPVTADGGDGSDTYIIQAERIRQFIDFVGSVPYIIPIANLQGPVSINDTGTVGTDAVTVDGTPGADTITQTGDQVVANGATITLTGVDNLTLLGGLGDDTIIITSTTVPVVADGGDGANTYHITMGNLAGPVTVSGTTGSNGLTVIAPPGANTLTLSATELVGAGETINLDLGTTASGITVDGSAGNNQLVLQGPPPGPVTAEQIAVAPVVGAIAAPVTPLNLSTVVSTSAAFTELDGSTVTAMWDWGDSTTSDGMVSQSGTAGSVSGDHEYSAAGVYTLTLTLTNSANQTGHAVFTYVVVYDLSAGFVTGGGWINSPAGAYVANPTLTGKANFGFVSKYQQGATVPTGNTEFQFKVADFNFKSTSYEWLVVSGAKARFRGVGTVNGAAGYGFELTAWDGQVNSGGDVDRFRIKIWDGNHGNGVVYDNIMMGASDGADPTTGLGGGSIVIHKGGSNLVLGAAGSSAPTGALRGDDVQLATAHADAMAQWTAQGLSSIQIQRLQGINVVWADLPGNSLGLASESTNYVWIDRDAAGYGWSQSSAAPESGRVDLFSTVTHEFGHMLGYDHDVLGDSLQLGERHVTIVADHRDHRHQQLGTPLTHDFSLLAGTLRPIGNLGGDALVEGGSSRLGLRATSDVLDHVFRNWSPERDVLAVSGNDSMCAGGKDFTRRDSKSEKMDETLDDDLLAELAAALT